MWSYLKNLYFSALTKRQNVQNKADEYAHISETFAVEDNVAVKTYSESESDNLIKQEVIRLKMAGESIVAEWNAGGDDTCCNVKIKDIYNYTKDGVNICWDLIAETLELPNAGEYYNKGHGEIDVNQEGQVVLRYSTRAYYYDGSDEEEENTDCSEWIAVEDLFGLSQYLHRVKISFSLWMTVEESGNIGYETYNQIIHLSIMEGDEIILPKEAESYYLNVIKNHLQKFEPEFAPKEEQVGSKTLQSMYISGTLEPSEIRLQLHKSYEVIDFIAENEFVVLIE